MNLKRRLPLLLVAALHLVGMVSSVDSNIPIPTTILESGSEFPMLGLAIDGTPEKEVTQRIYDAMQNSTKYLNYDLTQRNENQQRVSDGIVLAVKSSALHDSRVHVTYRISYTYLGYERTKLAVQEGLKALKSRNTHVHLMLEWPRCDDNIPWMNCEEDEKKLPASVKNAGPPPHLNKEFAFVDSWRALEDIYLREVSLGEDLAPVASIGVSNFEVEDLQTLEMHSRVLPHILQVSDYCVVR